MSYGRPLIKLREFQIFNTINAPYSHPGMTGTTVGAALDFLFAVLRPNAQTSVADVASLPLVGNTVNDYRIVLDDGDGRAAGYRWEQREGDASPSWYKVHDMDWSNDAILAALTDQTQELYVARYGRQDLDASGNPIVGVYAGQTIYGGSSSGNLTLNANAGDGSGSPALQTGYIQLDSNTRPTSDAVFSIGTSTERLLDVFLSRNLSDGTVTVTVAQAKTAYDHSQITDGSNPHATSYDGLTAKLGVVTFNGDVSGSVDLSASGAKTSTITVTDDSHNHTVSTITDFDDSVWAKLKTSLVDTSEANWTFNDLLEEAALDITVDTSAITDITSPAANKVLVSNALGDAWVTSNGTIELTGDVTGTATYSSTTDKWAIATTVASSNISGLGGVELQNKTFTSATGSPTTVTATAHGLATGEKIRIFGSTLTGEKTVTVVDANTFTIPDVTAAIDSGYYIPQGGQLLYNTTTGDFQVAKEYEEIRLGELSGLTEDVLSIYVAKDGRTTGQTVHGGISASENLDLDSTSHATKGTIRAKSNLTPFTDASYSGGWSGTDLGSSGVRWNNLYMAGEAVGFRAENVGSLPVASGTQVGRVVFYDGTLWVCDGAQYIKAGSSDVVTSTKVANYTLTDADDIILANGTLTLTLPAAATITKKFTIKNIGTGTVTIDGDGSETIDGALTHEIFDQYHSVNLVSDGTGWFIL